MNIQLSKIRPPKELFRPVRKDTVEYHELLNSVKVDGILQPILVRPVGDLYEVVEGNWRFCAALDASLTEIPCLVRECTDREVEVLQLKAQAIRPETAKSDFAIRLKTLMLRDNLTMAQLGKLVSKSTSWVSRMLSLTNLSPPVRKMVDRGEISLQNADTLSRIPATIRGNFTQFAVMQTSREFEDIARRAIKDVRECSQQDTTAWAEYRDSHYVAYLRQLSEVRAEASSNRASGRILRKLEAATPLDGWVACLAWLLHIDPDSLGAQKAEKEAHYLKRLKFEARKKRNEELLKELRNLTPEIHYEH